MHAGNRCHAAARACAFAEREAGSGDEAFDGPAVLAMLYTVRVVAGGAALAISLSSWLLAFSMFVFISLAYLKRYIEISALAEGQLCRI